MNGPFRKSLPGKTYNLGHGSLVPIVVKRVMTLLIVKELRVFPDVVRKKLFKKCPTL